MGTYFKGKHLFPWAPSNCVHGSCLNRETTKSCGQVENYFNFFDTFETFQLWRLIDELICEIEVNRDESLKHTYWTVN